MWWSSKPKEKEHQWTKWELIDDEEETIAGYKRYASEGYIKTDPLIRTFQLQRRQCTACGLTCEDTVDDGYEGCGE